MSVYFVNLKRGKAEKELKVAKYLGHGEDEEAYFLKFQNDRIFDLFYRVIQFTQEEGMVEILIDTNNAIKQFTRNDDRRILVLMQNYGDPSNLMEEYYEKQKNESMVGQTDQSVATDKKYRSKYSKASFNTNIIIGDREADYTQDVMSERGGVRVKGFYNIIC